jgi:hypothetical protein
MTLALPGHGNTAHSAAQPLRLWFGLPVAIAQASNELIAQIKELNKDREFAVFFSAVSIDKDATGMHHIFYGDGEVDHIGMAIGTGAVVLAEAVTEKGYEPIEVLEHFCRSIAHAKNLHDEQKELDAIDETEGGGNA